MLNLVLTILIFGGILLLAFIKFTNAVAVNGKANRYFGLFLLLWSTFWLDEVVALEQVLIPLPILRVLQLFQFFTPLAFYLSIVFYTNPTYRYRPKDLIYLLGPVFFTVLLYMEPYLSNSIFHHAFIVLFLGNALFYNVLAYIRLRQHAKNIESFASVKEPIDLHWLMYIIYALALAAVATIVYNIFDTTGALNVFINALFLSVVYFVAYHSLKQKEIYPKGYTLPEVTEETQISKPGIPNKKDPEDQALLQQKEALLHLMNTQQPYLESELTLVRLAEMTGLSVHQLSHLINTCFQENFFLFINRYRVEKAKALLTDPRYASLTIIAIGYDAGFNSKTAFNTTFKKITGQTPSAYRQAGSTL